jgi:hypothetical protein
MSGELGRRIPTDWTHVERYGLMGAAAVTPEHVERLLPLPYGLRRFYDQGDEGACVGYGWSWAMSILNGEPGHVVKYDAGWLYHAAQLADDWPETPPEDGTSVRAGGDVLRLQGAVRMLRGKDQAVNLQDGIAADRWATSVDQMRACILAGLPVVIGVNWYHNFDTPVPVGRETWIGRGDLGSIRGGHCVCLYGASDRRQAFRLVNNWGISYPLVWLPYDVMQRLIGEDGEVAVIVDR